MYEIKNTSKSQRIVDIDGKRHYIQPGDRIESVSEPTLPENLFKIKKVKKDGRTKSVE